MRQIIVLATLVAAACGVPDLPIGPDAGRRDGSFNWPDAGEPDASCPIGTTCGVIDTSYFKDPTACGPMGCCTAGCSSSPTGDCSNTGKVHWTACADVGGTVMGTTCYMPKSCDAKREAGCVCDKSSSLPCDCR